MKQIDKETYYLVRNEKELHSCIEFLCKKNYRKEFVEIKIDYDRINRRIFPHTIYFHYENREIYSCGNCIECCACDFMRGVCDFVDYNKMLRQLKLEKLCK